MTANGVAAWKDLDGDGIATATLNSGGGTPDANSVTTGTIVDGAIVDADINAAAAIALSKLATNPLARANHTGTQTMSTISDAGTLATLSAVASAQITDGTIAGGDLSSTIAIPSAATATTQTAADNSTKVSTTAYVDTGLALKANLASPTFTGHPVGVTEAANDNSTNLASTAYVDRARYKPGFLSGWGYDIRAGVTGAVWPAASRGFFVKPQGVKKVGCTTIYVAPTIASGNLNVAVYAQTGSLLTTVPSGNPLVSSGSTVVGTANTMQAVTIASTDIDPELHWLFVMVDNTTAAFVRVTASNDGLAAGWARSYVGATTVVPTSGFSLSNTATYIPWIGYG